VRGEGQPGWGYGRCVGEIVRASDREVGRPACGAWRVTVPAIKAFLPSTTVSFGLLVLGAKPQAMAAQLRSLRGILGPLVR
jgi:hypothetical protein